MKRKAIDYCIFCDDFHEYVVKETVEKVPVGDIYVTITRHRAYCAHCGKEMDVKSLSSIDHMAAFEAYKRAKGLVTAEEIVALRKKHGLTASGLAKALGMGEKSITRFENGDIQSKSVNLLLRLAMEDSIFDALQAINAGSESEDSQLIVLNLPKETVEYYKSQSEEVGASTEHLLSAALIELAKKGMKPQLAKR